VIAQDIFPVHTPTQLIPTALPSTSFHVQTPKKTSSNETVNHRRGKVRARKDQNIPLSSVIRQPQPPSLSRPSSSICSSLPAPLARWGEAWAPLPSRRASLVSGQRRWRCSWRRRCLPQQLGSTRRRCSRRSPTSPTSRGCWRPLPWPASWPGGRP
jgi:hypothetical protein